jgi:hypothetical protein
MILAVSWWSDPDNMDLRDGETSHLERRAFDPYDIGKLVSAGDPRLNWFRGQPTRRQHHETENLP